MAVNVEIKARVPDPEDLEARVRELAGGDHEVLRQTDVFFRVPEGRLKLRSFAEGPAELIFYRRPDDRGTKVSNYHIHRTDDPTGLGALLGRALGEKIVVKKVRRLYLVGQTRIHLDRVDGLGDFMELEVVLRPGQDAEEGHAIARDLMSRLGVLEEHLVRRAYADLLHDLEVVASEGAGSDDG